MIQKAKKKTSFLLSILITGILGTIGGYVNSNYSKNSSLLAPIAKADIPATSADIFGGSSAGDAGSGDGGGSGGDGGGSGGDCSSSGGDGGSGF
ncbi:MAG: hypothetical protein WC724_03465 [Candidatus Paceibacterota bacterium]|jgi:hypothetical protein